MTNPEYETITPEKARRYIAGDRLQRKKLNPRQVAHYAAEIKAGRWEPDMGKDPIKFDSAGNVLDGWVRLHAIAGAGVVVSVMVWHDCPRYPTEFLAAASEEPPPSPQMEAGA